MDGLGMRPCGAGGGSGYGAMGVRWHGGSGYRATGGGGGSGNYTEHILVT